MPVLASMVAPHWPGVLAVVFTAADSEPVGLPAGRTVISVVSDRGVPEVPVPGSLASGLPVLQFPGP